MTTIDAKTRVRFWTKVRVAPADACWEWLASKTSFGYGMFRFGGRNVVAHRVAYLMLGVGIPDGLQLDHLCRNSSCVNPSHLEAVTPRVNTLRGTGIATINSLKTHCDNGHLFDEANTYIRPNGCRFCRACGRAAQARARIKKLTSGRLV